MPTVVVPKGWKDEYYVQIYKLAREGMSNPEICQSLGVPEIRFRKWRSKLPALSKLLKDARRGEDNVHKVSAIEKVDTFVYDRLPDRLKEVWDGIMASRKKQNPIQKIESLLADAGKAGRQQLFLYALIRYNYNLSRALRAVNVTKKTFDAWVTTDPDFADLLQEMEWHKGNFIEAALMQLVKKKEPAAVIFASKTFNAGRGYGAKTTVVHKGNVQHDHNLINLDELPLSLEDKKRIRDAIRSRQGDQVPALPAHEEVIEGEIEEDTK